MRRRILDARLQRRSRSSWRRPGRGGGPGLLTRQPLAGNDLDAVHGSRRESTCGLRSAPSSVWSPIWDHLIYAYMIENTRAYEILGRVICGVHARASASGILQRRRVLPVAAHDRGAVLQGRLARSSRSTSSAASGPTSRALAATRTTGCSAWTSTTAATARPATRMSSRPSPTATSSRRSRSSSARSGGRSRTPTTPGQQPDRLPGHPGPGGPAAEHAHRTSRRRYDRPEPVARGVPGRVTWPPGST